MTKNNHFWTNPDIGALILRITLSGLLIMHGIHKVLHGIEGPMQALVRGGIPGQFIYFVYISEVLAPVLIVLGVLTRMSVLSIVITMLTIIYVIPAPILGLGEHGASSIEIQLFYLLSAVALFFIGPGRYRLRRNDSGHWLLD